MKFGKGMFGSKTAGGPAASSTDGQKPTLLVKGLLGLVLIYLVVCVFVGWYWNREPGITQLVPASSIQADRVEGEVTVATVEALMTTLLNKPGGYLSNDIMPPGVWLDNMPHWEFGVLVQIRDVTRAMRRDMARSQSQSAEDEDLARAEPLFHFDNKSWIMPSTEGEYRSGLKALNSYAERLNADEADFYARADNLGSWLGDVSTRLGSLSQRLSASVGQAPVTDGSRPREQTPWLEIDDVFYESRGSAWALVHLLRAVETDFADIIAKKNAQASLQQIIRELEATQEPLWSPMVLNGGGFGVLANHSLVMANYLSRANAAIIDLRRLMEQG